MTRTGSIAQKQTDRNPDMGRAALWYARQGLAVFPIHEPLFDHPLGFRCTCEEWRHGDWAKKNTPHRYLEPGQHCKGPGKCPRGKWKDESTTDPDTIRGWWKRWPTANIGIDCGKSGLLILDADTYKDSYTGDGLLTRADEETVTTLTGGGGTHLWYKRPDGKDWGNAKKGLPGGIDIRGDGGYIVAPPSLHETGKRYAFEGGYGLTEIALLPIPGWLAAILDKAAESSPSRAGIVVRFTEPTTDWPDLAAWNLSPKTLQTINTPPSIGKRSEADYSICLALCYAGAADRDILAVFQHYPVGVSGKFAERGRDYLERTVTSARAYVAQNPGPRQVIEQIPALRAWVKTTSFADFVPADLQSSSGYRTDGTDTKIADALLDVCEERGSFRVIVSPRDLALRAGLGSHHTANKALDRLAGWFADRGEGGLVIVTARRLPIFPTGGGIEKMGNLRATYSARKADDVFLTGRSLLAKKLGNEEPGLGETILRIIDALESTGTATRRELAEQTGKTLSAVGRACRRGEELGLLDADRPDRAKEYSLADWESEVERLRPTLKTHFLGLERADRTWEGRQRFAEKQLRTPGLAEEERAALNRSRGRAVAQRIALGPVLHPDWADEEIARFILAPIPGRETGQAVYDERRVIAYEGLTRQASDLLAKARQTGGLFWPSELAQYRTVVGRLGLDAAQTVARVEL